MSRRSYLGKAQDLVTKAMFGSETAVGKESFSQLIDRDMNGNEVKMSSFQGSVLCCVNVASK